MPVAKSRSETTISHSDLASRIAAMPRLHDNNNPLWAGPCGVGPMGGITQSMLSRFLSCRERFRLKYVLGLEPPDRWNHRLGYGNMWHVCEESHASTSDRFPWKQRLHNYTEDMLRRYPLQRDEIAKWYSVCIVQFHEYANYWADHPDVRNRTPLLQEKVFDVSYTLPSGRIVRLRGKWDSVDLIRDELTGPNGGIYLQENKTKGDIDKMQVERQLRFDLQTMFYLIALDEYKNRQGNLYEVLRDVGALKSRSDDPIPILGVRYNVVRRPLSGGRGSITPHKEKRTKAGGYTPAETPEAFYERLRRDYIAAEPDYWFFRVRAEVSQRDVQVFRQTCLDPLLETVCWWYEYVTDSGHYGGQSDIVSAMNYRTPFGVYSALEEGGATEYDHYLDTGSEATLRRVDALFPELQPGA